MFKKRKRNIPEAEAVVDSDIWTLSWSFRISESDFIITWYLCAVNYYVIDVT